MKIDILTAFILTMLFHGCAGHNDLLETSPQTETMKKSEKISLWLDEETDTVHTLASQNGTEKIVSTIKYKEGNPLEVMKIIISENINGKIHWIYFVPSTGYEVDLTMLSISDNGMNVEWKNKTAEGAEDSGTDLFVRCCEKGFVEGKEKAHVKESESKIKFPSFDK